MKIETFALCFGLIALTGCAAPTNGLECLFQPGRVLDLSVCSDQRPSKADKVQVHSETGGVPGGCEKIGPVIGFAEATVGQPTQAAQVAARERVADLGGDTLVVSSVKQGARTTGSSVTVRGMAWRCQGLSASE